MVGVGPSLSPSGPASEPAQDTPGLERVKNSQHKTAPPLQTVL